MKRRVVITGMGTINPVGNSVDESFDAIIDSKNGLGPITYFDTEKVKISIAGELKNINFEDYLDKKEIKRSDKVMILGTIAAMQAYQDSGLKDTDYDPYRFGTFVTSGIGGLDTMEKDISIKALRGADRISPFFHTKFYCKYGRWYDIY